MFVCMCVYLSVYVLCGPRTLSHCNNTRMFWAAAKYKSRRKWAGRRERRGHCRNELLFAGPGLPTTQLSHLLEVPRLGQDLMCNSVCLFQSIRGVYWFQQDHASTVDVFSNKLFTVNALKSENRTQCGWVGTQEIP